MQEKLENIMFWEKMTSICQAQILNCFIAFNNLLIDFADRSRQIN